MARLFGIDMPSLFNSAMGPGVLDATLTVVSAGTRTPGSLTGGTNATTATYAARGLVEDYDASQIDGTIVQRGDRKVMLLAASIATGKVPVPGDRVTISGSEYRIVNVERDSGEAVYVCQARYV